MNIIPWSIEQSRCCSSRWLFIYSLQRPRLTFHSITPSAAFLIGATIKVKLKASKHDSTSQILFFGPNEERSISRGGYGNEQFG